jgi:hypothetical protein
MKYAHRPNPDSADTFKQRYSYAPPAKMTVHHDSTPTKSTPTILEWIIYLMGGSPPKCIRGTQQQPISNT